jgi:hypothetical protein
MTIAIPTGSDATQADALAILVELEARWETIPVAAATAAPRESMAALVAKQKAFDAYHVQMVAYNRQYHPAYHGQRPATTAVRLAAWCRSMADLYGRAGQVNCPVNVLEQAHRAADRLGVRLNRESLGRQAANTTPEAIAVLRSVAEWCDGLAGAAAATDRVG